MLISQHVKCNSLKLFVSAKCLGMSAARTAQAADIPGPRTRSVGRERDRPVWAGKRPHTLWHQDTEGVPFHPFARHSPERSGLMSLRLSSTPPEWQNLETRLAEPGFGALRGE